MPLYTNVPLLPALVISFEGGQPQSLPVFTIPHEFAYNQAPEAFSRHVFNVRHYDSNTMKINVISRKCPIFCGFEESPGNGFLSDSTPHLEIRESAEFFPH